MRLIDADKLILHLNDYALQGTPFRGESADTYNAIKQCIEAVEEQPTSYDRDEVLHEIQSEVYKSQIKMKNSTSTEKAEYYKGEMMGLISADSKVRMAGVGKGSCHWMFHGEGFNFYKTGCGKGCITMDGSIKDKKYKYCPYCGREILEVDLSGI